MFTPWAVRCTSAQISSGVLCGIELTASRTSWRWGVTRYPLARSSSCHVSPMSEVYVSGVDLISCHPPRASHSFLVRRKGGGPQNAMFLDSRGDCPLVAVRPVLQVAMAAGEYKADTR